MAPVPASSLPPAGPTWVTVDTDTGDNWDSDDYLNARRRRLSTLVKKGGNCHTNLLCLCLTRSVPSTDNPSAFGCPAGEISDADIMELASQCFEEQYAPELNQEDNLKCSYEMTVR